MLAKLTDLQFLHGGPTILLKYNQHHMDPILILVASIFAILLALIIVNFYYICGHYFHHLDYTKTATQMFQNPRVHNEIQTENCSHTQDKEVQNMPQTETTGTDPQNSEKVENYIQTEKVYCVTLPEQLDHISEQLTTNRQDLTCCMEWVGECEQTTLAAAHVIDQQTQLLQSFRDSIQLDNVKNFRNIVLIFYKMYNFS